MANNLIDKTANLPELPRQQQIYARADSVLFRQYPRDPDNWHKHNTASEYLAALDAIMPEAQAVLDDLRALARPASNQEIAKCLAILVKCYPNTGTADGEVYGRMLIEDVASMQPSVGDIEAACRHLRHTSRFTPAISEVLEAITEAKNHRHEITRKIVDITSSRDKRVREVEEEHQRHREYLEYQQTRYQPGMESDPTAVPL
jgi:DNA-directed RNA polymerase subunit F